MLKNQNLSSAIISFCEALSENYPCKVTRIGLKEFGQSGEQRELMHYYRLTADELAEDIERMLKTLLSVELLECENKEEF